MYLYGSSGKKRNTTAGMGVMLDSGIDSTAGDGNRNERLASETERLLGQPLSQRIDMDQDGRLETVRRFRRSDFSPDDAGELVPSESDWDGSRVIRSWELVALIAKSEGNAAWP
ncbi:MAG: hypothetical protein LBK63_10035 [Treponema sp.]|nr:hypothetical protein [Treponema sp.]